MMLRSQTRRDYAFAPLYLCQCTSAVLKLCFAYTSELIELKLLLLIFKFLYSYTILLGLYRPKIIIKNKLSIIDKLD